MEFAGATAVLGGIMSPFRFDMLILAAVIAGAAIGGIYLFMLAVPRNDDEYTHDGLSDRKECHRWSAARRS